MTLNVLKNINQNLACRLVHEHRIPSIRILLPTAIPDYRSDSFLFLFDKALRNVDPTDTILQTSWSQTEALVSSEIASCVTSINGGKP